MSQCRRCDYRADDLADHATEARHPLCIVDQRRSLPPDRTQTCLTCLAATRAALARVRDLARLLPAVVHAGYPANTRPDKGHDGGDESPIPGGDALVLLAGGGDGRAETADTWRESDPPSVEAVLATWEDDVRHVMQLPAGGRASTDAAAGFLLSRLSWLAEHHPAFGEMARDFRGLRARLERVTGTDDRPEEGAPCMECKTPLVRDWTDTGLSETYRCRSCGRDYDPASYWLAVKAAMIAEQEAS